MPRHPELTASSLALLCPALLCRAPAGSSPACRAHRLHLVTCFLSRRGNDGGRYLVVMLIVGFPLDDPSGP